ncbi:MAG: DUF2064 domain-containing protein [Nitrospinae bacterium]|nr:DUF2064 domain-containing protein [Nitrospinota bacterium]
MHKLLIFAKSPIKGKVKTRLKKNTPLTDDNILKLYTAFLKDTIVSASLSNVQKIYIAYYPEDSEKLMHKTIFKSTIRNLKSKIKMFPQSGNDFDDRVTNAIKEIHNDIRDNIVILGSDSPHIQPAIINRAFRFLSTPPIHPLQKGGKGGGSPEGWGNLKGSMVLGPSGEGGVYLIGLRYEGKINFKGVFIAKNESDNLLKIARRKKLSLLLLEELTDVDVKSDLITLISNLSMIKYSSHYTKIHLPQYTLNAIKRLGLTVTRKGNGTREKYLIKAKSKSGFCGI